MGLDQYLSKKVYVQRWEHTPPEKRYAVQVTKGGQEVPNQQVNPERVTYVTEEVGYWRKANAIHRWFVENCQGGVDDCRSAYVVREQLEELLETVERVLVASKLVDGEVINGYSIKGGKMIPRVGPGRTIEDPSVAKQLLPTQEGFFFGSTEYDQWYYEDLELTRNILKDALSDPEAGEFEYASSW